MDEGTPRTAEREAGSAEERALGLRRIVLDTPAGPVVARVGPDVRGKAVLLVHGAAGSWRGWLPLLQRAAAGGAPLRDAVAVDLPGWGESPDPAAPLTAALAAASLAAVARAAGAERWTLVGHSLGGVIALELAAREPAAADRVVLVSPTGPAVLDAIRHPVADGLRLPWFAGMLLAMRSLAALPGGGRPLLRRLGRAGALGRLAAPLFADPRSVDPAVLDAFADEVRPAAFLRAARASRAVDPASWRAVVAPVRAVRGPRDVFAGAGDAAALARLLPDFAETVAPGAGHFALAERPDVVLELLRAQA